MKYLLTLVKRNPSEVYRKVISIVREKLIVKSNGARKVVIYSLGKAGTSSIYEALRYSRDLEVRHLHYVSEMPGEIDQWRFFEKKRAVEAKRWFNDGNTTIISLVRDPFSRSLSSVIQNYELYHKDNDFAKAIVENARTISLNWWDEEFFKSMDWDVYRFPFNKNKGYSQYQLGFGNKLIIIKSTHISTVGFKVLMEELNIKLKEKRVNRSADKSVALRHSDILENFKFTKKDFDDISNSRFMKHFYSDKEIRDLKNYWT